MVKKYLSYKDDDDSETIIRGYFEIIQEKETYIKIKTNYNKIIKLPWNRILKLKD